MWTCAYTCVCKGVSQETAHMLCSTHHWARGAQAMGPGGGTGGGQGWGRGRAGEGAPVPAGASQPGRPPGPALAPASRRGSCPGPAAAPGCFWVSAPPRYLQKGRRSVSERPSHLLHGDPANQSQPPTEKQLTGPTESSRQGSRGLRSTEPANTGARGHMQPGGRARGLGRVWVPRRAGREAVSSEWKVWPPDAPRSCWTSTRCAM